MQLPFIKKIFLKKDVLCISGTWHRFIRICDPIVRGGESKTPLQVLEEPEVKRSTDLIYFSGATVVTLFFFFKI